MSSRRDPLGLSDVANTHVVMMSDNRRRARDRPAKPAPEGAPRVLPMGLGVNSWAALLRLTREGNPPDMAIFADTRAEWRTTYAYRDSYIRPFCDAHGIPFYEATSRLGGLVDYYTARGAMPTMETRDCTTKFKTDVQAALLRSFGYGPKRPVRMLVGLAMEEGTRTKKHRKSDRARAWWHTEYPLRERRMNRDACKREIIAAGYPLPPKSGCTVCPFSGYRNFKRLLSEEPDSFEAGRIMEENARTLNPKMILLGAGMPTMNRIAGVPEPGERTLSDFDFDPAEVAPDWFDGGECIGAGECPP